MTLNHYRCFHDAAPASLLLESGKTTAFVGKNNAGKSALMRFFYEFKNALVNYPSGSWTGFVDGVSQTKTASDPNLGNRYGLGDLLDLYPNRDASKSVRFSIQSSGMLCEFEISKPSIHHAHGLVKTLSVDPKATDIAADIIVQFQNALYFGAHRNLVNEEAGGGGYFDLSVGTAFTNEWNFLKNGIDSQNASSALRAERLIADLLGWPSLSINASSDGKQIFLIRDGVNRYAISELGAGISELVICIVTAAIRRPSWILIDEPESHLHPSLQVKFLEALTLLATNGVIFTTHSVGLARTCADSIYVVEQNELGRSSLRAFEGVNNFSQLMGELSFSQLHELGFNKLLLCEGVTEVKTLRQILRHWKLDGSVMVIPLGGTTLIDAKRQDELYEFNRFGVEVFVLVDSEKKDADTPKPDREKFIALCKRLFGDSHAIQTKFRATENYFTAEAIKKAMRSDKYVPLEPFQSASDVELFWGKNKNWQIAAEMSKADWQRTDLGNFFDVMAGVP